MRLVCDKCSSIYTIEDSLVGERDFSVSCKQCGTPIIVRKARQVSSLPPPPNTAVEAAQAPLARPQRRQVTSGGEEAWFVSIESAEEGPFNALELARMLEQERISWATPVWREGLKAWRPARRDASLVTAVAGARGYAGDTMRLTSSRSFLAPDDTIIEVAPRLLPEAALYGQAAAAAPDDDLLSSNSETKALDMRAAVERETRPSHRPASYRPAAWSSPQNEAFRQQLRLDDSLERSPPSHGGAPTLAEAFASAPSLIHSQNLSSTELSLTTSRPPGEQGWSTRAQSFWAVAAMAFAGGVLVAALWARMIGPTSASPKGTKPTATERTQTLSGSPQKAPLAATKSAAASSAPANEKHATANAPSAPESAAAKAEQNANGAVRELPNPDELRDAVREVAAEVKRCVVNPARGVDVDLYLDGTTGRVRDVQVRSPQLPPGRVACINHALSKLQVGPFARPELKLMHKFSW
jgi:predicted Zn finger-like uncharacterized protein